MEYVLLDMRWNVVLKNKELDFDIKQLAAIHIDEELHTISTFHRLDAKDIKTAKQITYMMEVSDDVIMDFDSAWEEFIEWLPENAVFIVWNSEIRHAIQRCNKIFRKKQIKAKFVDLYMLQEAMFPMHSYKKSLGGVMGTLGLTCMQTHMLSVLYCAQCMLRLYRKLWKEGRKHLGEYEWEDILLSGDFSDFKMIRFFSEAFDRKVQMECGKEIRDFCREKQYGLRIRGTAYEIDADNAVWKFDLVNGGTDLTYIPKKYVHIPHRDARVNMPEKCFIEILPHIFTAIASTEERLKYGVGSSDVEELLNMLCNLKYS